MKRTKQSNGSGSVARYKNGWRARLTTTDGRRVAICAGTRDEAERRMRQTLVERDQGLPVITATTTVAEFAAQWLETKRPSWKHNTYLYNEGYVRVHILPVIGALTLARLTPAHLQTLYTRKRNEGMPPTSVHHLHAVLHGMLKCAVKWGMVTRNVADAVDPPRLIRRRMVPLDQDDVQRLLAGLNDHSLETLVILALNTGMRLGELLALRWRDIHLSERYIEVTATLLKDGKTSTPKTPGSQRRVALSETAIRALSHLERSLDRVFPFTHSQVDYRYSKIAHELTLPARRFHDLRHTFATLLLAKNVPAKIVQETLGHANISTTLDLYSHVSPSMQAEAARAIDEIMAFAE
jgi:integrase